MENLFFFSEILNMNLGLLFLQNLSNLWQEFLLNEYHKHDPFLWLTILQSPHYLIPPSSNAVELTALENP